jgi:phosphoglycolate phosphatase
MSNPRLAIFDLDGTLVDSAPDLHAALDRLAARRGLAPYSREHVTGMIGDGAKALVERALAARERPFDPAALEEFLADYEARSCETSRPFAGVEAALDALAASGWRLAICTNKPLAATRAMLRELGLAPRFAHVVGGDSLPSRKPDPAPVRAILAEAGVAAGAAVMIGDHANDILAARGAGVRSVFCAWGYGRDCGADSRAEAPGDLPRLL